MIVPAGFMCLDDDADLRSVMLRALAVAVCSMFAIRPTKLFEGVDQRLCVLVARAGPGAGTLWSAR